MLWKLTAVIMISNYRIQLDHLQIGPPTQEYLVEERNHSSYLSRGFWPFASSNRSVLSLGGVSSIVSLSLTADGVI